MFPCAPAQPPLTALQAPAGKTAAMLPQLLPALRDAHWLGADRARAYRLLLGLTCLGASAAWLLLSHDGIDPAGRPLGTDFLAFWSAARLALAGTPAAAWDLARIGAVERGAFTVDPGLSSFLYPPPFLLVCLPFGTLPYPAALAAWLLLTGAAWLLALRCWLPERRGEWLTAAAFPAVLVNLGHGQNGFLTAALLGGGLWLVGQRPWLAGAVLGAMICKPQLALALPVLVLAGGHWRVLGGAVAGSGALCLLALAMFGPQAWLAFLQAASLGEAILEHGLVQPGKMVSLYAAARLVGMPHWASLVIQLSGALAAALLLLRVVRTRGIVVDATAALTAACTVLMSPFLLDYDLMLTAIPLGWLFVQGLRHGFAPWDKLVLAAAYLLPLIARPVAMATGVPLAPFVLWALALAVARAARRQAAAAATACPSSPA